MQDQVWEAAQYETIEQVKAAIMKVWEETYGIRVTNPTRFGLLTLELNKHFNIIVDVSILSANPGIDVLAGYILGEIKKKADWALLTKPRFVPNQKVYVPDGRWYVEERVKYCYPSHDDNGKFVKWVYTTFPNEDGDSYTGDETEIAGTAGEALKYILKDAWVYYRNMIKGIRNVRTD